MSKVLKIRVGRSGKKKKAEVPIIGYQISLFLTEMLPMPWQEVQICVHDVHETHIILQLVHTENCSDLKNVEFAGSIINNFFIFYFIQNAVLRRKKSSSGQGRSESKKKKIFFLGSGPKIGSVGTWETDNQLDVP